MHTSGERVGWGGVGWVDGGGFGRVVGKQSILYQSAELGAVNLDENSANAHKWWGGVGEGEGREGL